METNEILILIGVIILIVIIGTITILFLTKKVIKTSVMQKQDILNTKPKRTVEYLDTFFHNDTIASVDTDSFQVEYIVRDINTNEIFIINEVNAEGIQLELNFDKVKVYRGTKENRQEIKVGDKGSLWIDENTKQFIKIRKDDTIKVGYKRNLVKYTYGGCALDSNFKGVNKRFVMYNMNNKNDLSLYEKAKNAFGILKF